MTLKLIVIEADGHYNAPTYIVAREGFIAAPLLDMARGSVYCRCEDIDCDHLVATDTPYYNTAPDLDTAKQIVEAWNAQEEAHA